MDFGKLPRIDHVDFRLPSDDPQTARVLAALPRSVPAVYVGCPIWTPKEWVGSLYPSSARDKDFLSHYTRQFNTIELNSTHYHIPDAATVSRWKAAATSGFTFCPKLPQEISHDRVLQGTEALTRAFCDSVRELGPALGVCFLQLPPQFGSSLIGVLENYLSGFPTDIPLAVEFRHPDWFCTDEGFSLLEKYGVSPVITDVAGRRDALHQRLTTHTTLIRFVGHDLHPTDYSRIDEWVERLASWLEQGLQNLYFFMHQPQNTTSPDLIAYLIPRLNERFGLSLSAPRFITRAVQGSLF